MKVGNNPQKQLYENTKDIDMLKDKIREAYHYNGSLDPTDVTCSRGTIASNFGYLFDNDANLFKFSDGDNNTLLIQYLTNLKGPQGIAGGSVPVEANPDEDATDTLNKILIGDTVYTAGGGGSTNKYRHCIKVTGQINAGGNGAMTFFIDSDSNKKFVKASDYVEGTNQDIHQWLADNNFDSATSVYPASVCKYNTGGSYTGVYLYIANGTKYFATIDGTTWTYLTNTTLVDVVLPL